MAYLEMKDGKKRVISAEHGLYLWKALRDPTDLNDADRHRLRGIKHVWLAWRTAPEEYIRENLRSIVPIALRDWVYDRQGRPFRPEDHFSWKFARHYGLWENGKPSALVTDPKFLYQATLLPNA